MPRGVVTPELKEQLFAAAESVLLTAGPGRLTSRAVTGSAGVATGLLYAHFGDFDTFLAGYATNRAFHMAAAVAFLPGAAGQDTVGGNLERALAATPLPMVRALTRLLAARPDLAAAVREVLGPDDDGAGGGLDAVRTAVVTYLEAEQRLGRVPAVADAAGLGLGLTALLHHVVLTAGTGPGAVETISRGVQAMLGAAVTR